MGALSNVRDRLVNVSTSLSAVEVGDQPPLDVVRDLAACVETLRRIRSEVIASPSESLVSTVRTQVAWDIDRMVADAERMRSSSLAPLARTALMKALHLRFSVLLTPAFWTMPISRGLMNERTSAVLARAVQQQKLDEQQQQEEEVQQQQQQDSSDGSDADDSTEDAPETAPADAERDRGL